MHKIAEKPSIANVTRVTHVALIVLRSDEAVKSATNQSPDRQPANCSRVRVSARLEVAFGVEIDLAQLVQGLGVG